MFVWYFILHTDLVFLSEIMGQKAAYTLGHYLSNFTLTAVFAKRKTSYSHPHAAEALLHATGICNEKVRDTAVAGHRSEGPFGSVSLCPLPASLCRWYLAHRYDVVE